MTISLEFTEFSFVEDPSIELVKSPRDLYQSCYFLQNKSSFFGD